jgi:hypothetical protein
MILVVIRRPSEGWDPKGRKAPGFITRRGPSLRWGDER